MHETLYTCTDTTDDGTLLMMAHPSDSDAIASRRTLTSSGSSSASSGNEKIQSETTGLFKELVKCTKIDCLIIQPVYQLRPVRKLPVSP